MKTLSSVFATMLCLLAIPTSFKVPNYSIPGRHLPNRIPKVGQPLPSWFPVEYLDAREGAIPLKPYNIISKDRTRGVHIHPFDTNKDGNPKMFEVYPIKMKGLQECHDSKPWFYMYDQDKNGEIDFDEAFVDDERDGPNRNEGYLIFKKF